MNLEIILGIIGTVLSIFALVVVFMQRDADRQAIVKGIEERAWNFNQYAQTLLNQQSDVIKTMQDIQSSSQQPRPELSGVLLNQWQFIEKVFRHRFEKHLIARKIAQKYISSNMRVLLDSGSTTDLVTQELLEGPANNVHVRSNNIFAAMHLVGTKAIDFYLYAGRFSDHFAAVYSKEALAQISNQSDFDLFILAATTFRFDSGIMVHMDDSENDDFKREALIAFERSLASPSPSQLLIAVDPSKFLVPTNYHKGVVEERKWKDIISKAKNRMIIVTSPLPGGLSANHRALITREIEKFKSAGIRVDDNP